MKWLGSALRELFSLFVDDVWFTLALVVWVTFGILGLPKLPIGSGWDAPLLFLGCAIILVVSTWRAARVKSIERGAR